MEPRAARTGSVVWSDQQGLNMSTNRDERTLGELFADLSRDTRTLVQQELSLAKVELAEKASAMGKGAALLVGGGLIAYGGLLAMIAAVILVLIVIGLPAWAAALGGGMLMAAAGYLLIRFGLGALDPQELTPRKTIATLKDNAEWLKAQTK